MKGLKYIDLWDTWSNCQTIVNKLASITLPTSALPTGELRLVDQIAPGGPPLLARKLKAYIYTDWRTLHPLIRDFAFALYPLKLNSWTILWILDWLEPVCENKLSSARALTRESIDEFVWHATSVDFVEVD
jgi:hypothetical protein